MNFRAKSAATIALAGASAVGTAGVASTSHRGEDGSHRFAASLIGYEEVPAISAQARGSFRARLTDEGSPGPCATPESKGAPYRRRTSTSGSGRSTSE